MMKQIQQSIFLLCFLVSLNSDGLNLLESEYPPTCTRVGQMFPDIHDCMAFFVCDDALVANHEYCNIGFYYDDHIENCDASSTCAWTVNASVETTATVEPSAVPKCTTPGEMFPDIYDCQAFFVCDTNLVPTYWQCTNSYYNHLTHTCDTTSTCEWAATTSTTTTAATTTTAEPSAVPTCARPAEMIPDIYDCHAFFACDDNLVPIHWHCTNNLYYNQLTENCVETSTCALTVTTSAATTTTIEPSAVPVCTKPAEMFPDIYDCHAFYVCDENLVPIPWNCNNLYYNAHTGVCDIESSCSWTVPTTDATTTTAPITWPIAVPTCTGYGQMFPDLYDCHAFFICDDNMIPSQMYCAHNLYYNMNTENCDVSSSCSWIIATTKVIET